MPYTTPNTKRVNEPTCHIEIDEFHDEFGHEVEVYMVADEIPEPPDDGCESIATIQWAA